MSDIIQTIKRIMHYNRTAEAWDKKRNGGDTQENQVILNPRHNLNLFIPEPSES